MGRSPAILQSEFPYNISARCINREWFNIPMKYAWEIFCEELTNVAEKKNLKIHSFVLMTNHFHLIASTPDSNISQCMHQFMTQTSKRLTRAGNRINETFAGRHFKCVLEKHNHYLNVYKYNYRNPVTAGICNKVEDYEFSSLRSVIKPSEKSIPLVDDWTYSTDPHGSILWLNSVPEPMHLEAVRYGLKRPVFTSKKCRNTNKRILDENQLI